jgi:hypothetical protein
LWTKEPGIRIHGTVSPDIIVINGNYFIYCMGPDSRVVVGIMVARSPDGLTFKSPGALDLLRVQLAVFTLKNSPVTRPRNKKSWRSFVLGVLGGL